MEAKKNNLYKGERLEESLREYFLSSGYYVIRGVKFKYDDIDVTDIDLWLYKRVSPADRNRGNVDIKNKKTPQAIERIFWAKGIMDVLRLDHCIVATTDRRDSILKFGLQQNVTILDGNFISKLTERNDYCRLTEEGFYHILNSEKGDTYKNSWKYIYENSKSRLLNELDFSGCNATLNDIRFFVEKIISDQNSRSVALRMLYITLSHFLIILDYISKDLAYVENTRRLERLLDGFKFGNLGRKGVQQFLDMAIYLTGNSQQPQSSINSFFEDQQVTIMAEFFSQNENINILFKSAHFFESAAFSEELMQIEKMDTSLKSIIGVILDYFNIERKKFFSSFNVN